MRRIADIAALTLEFVRFLVGSSRDKAQARNPFRDVLLGRLLEERVRRESRPFALSYIVVSALNGSAYPLAFRAIKTFAQEVPWQDMSSELLRRLFEVAIIHDELSIAQRVLNELSAKQISKARELEALKCLIEWRAGRVHNEAEISVDRTYFVAYPAYDEYFKGRISSSAGRLAEAREHFRRCLALAPQDAQELREDVRRRM